LLDSLDHFASKKKRTPKFKGVIPTAQSVIGVRRSSVQSCQIAPKPAITEPLDGTAPEQFGKPPGIKLAPFRQGALQAFRALKKALLTGLLCPLLIFWTAFLAQIASVKPVMQIFSLGGSERRLFFNRQVCNATTRI